MNGIPLQQFAGSMFEIQNLLTNSCLEEIDVNENNERYDSNGEKGIAFIYNSHFFLVIPKEVP